MFLNEKQITKKKKKEKFHNKKSIQLRPYYELDGEYKLKKAIYICDN